MNLQDALYNWLQIRIVAEGRPDDNAAKDTLAFFAQILEEDHHLSDVLIAGLDESLITVQFMQEGQAVSRQFPREAAEQLLADIRSNPKYNE